MPITIDIRTRFYGPHDLAYRLFPGQGYRYYDLMKDAECVFLDVPGINPPGPFGYLKDEEQLEAIVRAELKRDRLRRRDDMLADDLLEIDEMPLGPHRWSRARQQNLARMDLLYRTLAIGDTVLLPSARYPRGPDGELVQPTVLVGEIVGDPVRLRLLRGALPHYVELADYLVRPVRWLSESDEREFDQEVLRLLRTENSLVSLRKSFLNSVIGAAYNNMLIGDQYYARFTNADVDFSPRECFHFMALVMAVSAAYRKHVRNEGPFDRELSIYEIAALVEEDDEFVPFQEISIHSPGYATLRHRTIVGILASAIMALALHTHAEARDEGGEFEPIAIENSESNAPDEHPCEIEVEESVRGFLEMIDYKQWQEVCRAAVLANENEGLKPASQVVHD